MLVQFVPINQYCVEFMAIEGREWPVTLLPNTPKWLLKGESVDGNAIVLTCSYTIQQCNELMLRLLKNGCLRYPNTDEKQQLIRKEAEEVAARVASLAADQEAKEAKERADQEAKEAAKEAAKKAKQQSEDANANKRDLKKKRMQARKNGGVGAAPVVSVAESVMTVAAPVVPVAEPVVTLADPVASVTAPTAEALVEGQKLLFSVATNLAARETALEAREAALEAREAAFAAEKETFAVALSALKAALPSHQVASTTAPTKGLNPNSPAFVHGRAN